MPYTAIHSSYAEVKRRIDQARGRGRALLESAQGQTAYTLETTSLSREVIERSRELLLKIDKRRLTL